MRLGEAWPEPLRDVHDDAMTFTVRVSIACLADPEPWLSLLTVIVGQPLRARYPPSFCAAAGLWKVCRRTAQTERSGIQQCGACDARPCQEGWLQVREMALRPAPKGRANARALRPVWHQAGARSSTIMISAFVVFHKLAAVKALMTRHPSAA
jgi:hypothetical protein